METASFGTATTTLKSRWRSLQRSGARDDGTVLVISVRELPSSADAPRTSSTAPRMVGACTGRARARTGATGDDHGVRRSRCVYVPVTRDFMHDDLHVGDLDTNEISYRSRSGKASAPTGKGESAEKEKAASVSAPRLHVDDVARRKSVTSYCRSVGKSLGRFCACKRRRRRTTSDTIGFSKRLLPDAKKVGCLEHDNGALLSNTIHKSPLNRYSSLDGSSRSRRIRAQSVPNFSANVFVEEANMLSSCGIREAYETSSSDTDQEPSAAPSNFLDSANRTVDSIMLTAHRTSVSDQTLPVLPPPEFSASTLPISKAMQSTIAREVSRSVTQHASMSIAASASKWRSMDNSSYGGHGGSQPPPIPARNRSHSKSTGEHHRRPAPGLPPPLPPRNLSSNPSNTRNVYNDSDAIERDFQGLPPPPPPRNLSSNTRNTGNVYDDSDAMERDFSGLPPPPPPRNHSSNPRNTGNVYDDPDEMERDFPGLPPLPLTRNFSLNPRNTGHVYEDPDAMERDFGPLHDVRRWYRFVGSRLAGGGGSRLTVTLPPRPPALGTLEHPLPTSPTIHISLTHFSLLAGLRDLVKYGWYWGPLSRTEADELLDGKPDGTFLVRDSADDRYLLSLTYRIVGRTVHTRIQHHHGSFNFNGLPASTNHCHNVVTLIEKAMEQSEAGAFCHLPPTAQYLYPAPVRLLFPHSRFRTMRSLQQQCRSVIRQATRCDLICELPLPNIMKTYLMESSYIDYWRLLIHVFWFLLDFPEDLRYSWVPE